MPLQSREHPVPDDIDWVPYGIRHDGAQLLVDWCTLEDGGLAEPFFDQSIHRMLEHRLAATRSTPIEALGDVTSKSMPAGFIFHISRCGSTLITQMLASLRRFAVFSEPAILEKLLRGNYPSGEVSSEQRAWLLRQVIQAFAGCKASARGTFIKFSARAALDYRLITGMFPDVPCIFVYRDPVEVLVSLAGNQGDRLPPGLSEAGLLDQSLKAIKAMRPAEFWARVVESRCAAGLEICDSSRALLVNYNQLPEAVWTGIAKRFGIVLSAPDVARMQEAGARNAKSPGKLFSGDGAAKRAAATEEIRALADRVVRPYYNRLESIRGVRAVEA